jgi:hypothetical protein
MAFNTDVDIDVADRDKVLELFKHIPAKLTDNKKHKTGVYFHNVPADYLNGTCAIDYKQADDIGFFKLDVINNSAYKDIDSNKLDELISENPNWNLLLDPKIVSKLFHVHDHLDILQKLRPKNVEQLAAVLAIIRPAKRHLSNKGWNNILEEVWIKPTDGTYYFKKSHAISYAILIVMQLNTFN